MTRVSVFLLASLGLPAIAAAQQLPVLHRFYQAVADSAAPYSFAVAVVRNDSVVHLAGYGTRDGRRDHPVTVSTPFYIASSTKSFTALTAALLAHRGVLDLDAPISRYLGLTAIPAGIDPSRVTMRRLLSHRGGFESNPVAFRTAFSGELATDSIIPLMKQTARPVDTTFTYTNTQYILAALIMERVTGTPWQDLLVQEVGRPLGLSHMTARTSTLARDAAHGVVPGPTGYQWSPPKDDRIMHAAGGLLLSATDAGRWLVAQLNDGRVDGRQVFPARVIRETHRIVARQRGNFENIDRFGYALGWQVGLLHGDTLYHHFGNFPGAFAHVSFMPGHGVGVVVLTNSEMPAFGMAASVLAQRAYDAVLNREERDVFYATYPESLSRAAQRMFGIFTSDYARRSARPRTPPRGWQAYAGNYAAPEMGRVRIVAHADTAAEIHYGVMRSRLEVLSGDTLRVEVPPGRGGTAMPATFGRDGKADSINLRGTTFRRVGDPG